MKRDVAGIPMLLFTCGYYHTNSTNQNHFLMLQIQSLVTIIVDILTEEGLKVRGQGFEENTSPTR